MRKAFDLSLISRHRNAIYGFSILWVVVFHGAAINEVDYSFGQPWLEGLRSVISAGNVGVDVFLLLSGVCLYFSFQGNSDAYSFIKKRLARVVLPTLLVYFAYWFIRYCVLTDNVMGLVSRLTLSQFWMTGDQSIWFVSFILAMYVLYPYINGFLFSGRNSAIRLVLLLGFSVVLSVSLSKAAPDMYDMVEIALTRVPVFLFGCWLGKFVYEKKRVNALWVAGAVAAMVAFFAVLEMGVLHGMLKRYWYFVGGVSLCYCLALAFEVLSRFVGKGGGLLCAPFAFIGTFSLEWYLTHIMVNQVLRMSSWYVVGSFEQYLGVVLVSFVLAWAAMRITAPLARELTSECRNVAREE